MSVPRVDCPYCKKPTRQMLEGCTKTLMACHNFIDEDGNIINGDTNTVTDYRLCMECHRKFAIKYKANDPDNNEVYDSEGNLCV